MAEPRKFTRIKMDKYLGCLRQGMRRGAAAGAAGVTRWTVLAHAKADPDFAAQIEQAEVDACDIVEDALFKKALEGNVTAILVWLYNRSGGRWQDKRNKPEAPAQVDMAPEQLRELLKARGLSE